MAKQEIAIGDVLFLYVEEFGKNKYFILLGECEDEYVFASFYINTAKNYNFIPNKEVERFHIKLEAVKYPFLKYDSWLNLTELFPKSKRHILSEYAHDPSCLKYSLTESQLEFFRECVRNCGTIKGKYKKKFNFYD